MARKAGSLGLSVIATGIRDGLITPPALAAFARLSYLAPAQAASILAAGRDADPERNPEPWRTLITILTSMLRPARTATEPGPSSKPD